MPFAGIVSSGRLAAMYEKWGADFVVAEGSEAGGHIGDIGHPLPSLAREVLARPRSRSSPRAASTPTPSRVPRRRRRRGPARDALPRLLRRRRSRRVQGRCTSAKARRGRRDHHELREGDEGPRRAERVHRQARPRRGGSRRARRPGGSARTATSGARRPASSASASRSASARASNFKESFCITDALLAAAVKGDVESGLFYTGQSLVRIGEHDVTRSPPRELLADLEARLALEDAASTAYRTPQPRWARAAASRSPD